MGDLQGRYFLNFFPLLPFVLFAFLYAVIIHSMLYNFHTLMTMYGLSVVESFNSFLCQKMEKNNSSPTLKVLCVGKI